MQRKIRRFAPSFRPSSEERTGKEAGTSASPRLPFLARGAFSSMSVSRAGGTPLAWRHVVAPVIPTLRHHRCRRNHSPLGYAASASSSGEAGSAGQDQMALRTPHLCILAVSGPIIRHAATSREIACFLPVFIRRIIRPCGRERLDASRLLGHPFLGLRRRIVRC
jgi:hypothetical protein